MKRGFTLIESITVIAIIAILISITTYTITQAQRQARDANRKSDLAAISVAFQSRFESQVCEPADRNHYPGWRSFDYRAWQKASSISLLPADSCGPFSEFLTTVPSDPRYNTDYPYIVDYSTKPSNGKHFRLATKLERDISAADRTEYCRLSDIWQRTFGGHAYSGCSIVSFNPKKGIFAATITTAPLDEPTSGDTSGTSTGGGETPCPAPSPIGVDGGSSGTTGTSTGEECGESGGGGGTGGGGTGGENGGGTEIKNNYYNFFVGQ